MGQLVTTKIKLGTELDLTKNFTWSVPTVQDGTLVLERESSGVDLIKVLADDTVLFNALNTATNLTFTGQSARIYGDFSNADQSKRTMFQSSTVNGATSVGALANGTSKIANFVAYGGSDPLNCSRIVMSVDSAYAAAVTADRLGTGAYLPLLFQAGGSERFRLSETANRFQADWSNATNSLRLMFQSSTANGATTPCFLPNGTSKYSSLVYFGSSDPDNAAFMQVGVDGTAGTGSAFVQSGKTGTGVAGPLVLYTPGARMELSATQNRIQADFSSATSLGLKTNVTNGNTSLSLYPNGTGVASLVVCCDKDDPPNAAFIAMFIDAGTTWLSSNKNGTGVTRPMGFQVGGNTCALIKTDNTFNVYVTLVTNSIEVGAASEGQGDRNSLIDFHARDGSDFDFRVIRAAGVNGAAEIAQTGTGTFSISTLGGAPIIFKTFSADRGRIDSGGSVLIPSTAAWQSPGFLFDGGGKRVLICTDGTQPLELIRQTSDGTLIQFFRNTSAPGNITANSSNTFYNTSSDHRLKKNVRMMTKPLERLLRLNPVQFDWRLDDSEGEGFIAHELQIEVPNAVTGEKDAVKQEDDDYGKAGDIIPQGVDFSRIVPLLVAAVQELAHEVAMLKAGV